MILVCLISCSPVSRTRGALTCQEKLLHVLHQQSVLSTRTGMIMDSILLLYCFPSSTCSHLKRDDHIISRLTLLTIIPPLPYRSNILPVPLVDHRACTVCTSMYMPGTSRYLTLWVFVCWMSTMPHGRQNGFMSRKHRPNRSRDGIIRMILTDTSEPFHIPVRRTSARVERISQRKFETFLSPVRFCPPED